MSAYYYLLDAGEFEGELRPALAAGWRQRSFGPCRELCRRLLPAARAYAARYHTGAGEPVLARVAGGLAFDRTCWRTLVGEVLLFAAAEIPELQTCPDALCCLLAPGHGRTGEVPRERFVPIQQAHFGSRDLTFGLAVYRPEHAGFNSAADVARLADYLAAIDPSPWAPADLAPLPDLADDEARADELALVREWFPALVDLYQQARARGQVIVYEELFA